ncbi:MAG: hypothetical protein EZS28_005992 [Streblomastix strix]|uniref:Proteinase inhibitor I42 chagasin domain-containing protein n=1 Tax=Streblomastix strix TaxID=222440 RepID=A0A5J4WW81_9EUKA|nr:MAG: hypothetical protein EZS28_005992 [Streblomastix strix]
MLIFVLIVALCQSSTLSTKIRQIPRITTLQTYVNDTFEIKLPVSLTTGYRWILRTALNDDESIIKIISEIYLPDESINYNEITTFCGGVETQAITFIAQKTGTLDIEYIYRQIWLEVRPENEIRIYHVIVD